MKKDGTAVVEEIDDSSSQLTKKVDDLLEKFVGIRDDELSGEIVDIGKNAVEPDVFAAQLDAKLSDFEFPDDFVLDVYDLLHPGN